MHVPEIELYEAATLQEASDLLVRYAPDARLLAGGTDLLVDLKTGRINTGHVISIDRIAELRGISQTDAGLRITALTTIAELNRSELVTSGPYAAIRDATSQMANTQVRNVATVAGNIVSAVPCADLPPILMVMHAAVHLWSPSSERTVPLELFFDGPRQTVRRDEEVVTAVTVPSPPERFGAAYKRFTLRNGNAIAVAAVAASVELDSGDTVRSARVALGAVAPLPMLVPSVDSVLVGRILDEDCLRQAAREAKHAANPIEDVRGSVEYRRELVETLTQRALSAAHDRAKEVTS